MVDTVRIGLTGGIGSGKSTVATLLGRHGAHVIDADAIVHGLTQSGGSAIDPIRQQFGADFIDASGALDRKRMRDLVFADTSAKTRLEAIIHPLVGAIIATRTDQVPNAGLTCIVIEIPLLVESGRWRQRLDHVLVVDCDQETQLARTIERNALDRAAVLRIIAAQVNRQQRLRVADSVLFNQGLSVEQLTLEVAHLAAFFGLSSRSMASQ